MTSSNRGPLGRLRFVAGALIVMLAFAQPSSVSASDTQHELQEARKRLGALRKDLHELRAAQQDIHAQILSITARLSQATAQIEALDEAREEADAQLAESRAQVAQLQDDLNARARDAYIRGPAGGLELVLEADSLANLTDRIGFLEILSSADANVADGLRVERQQIAQFRAQLRHYLDEKKKLLAQLEKEGAVLEGKYAEYESARQSVAEKVKEAEKTVAQLTAEIQRQLLQQYGINVGPPLHLDGPFYACPVDPPRSYVDDFGAPRVGHTHQGNDIFAPEGTTIRAPFEGTAEEGYDGLGGTVVHVYASANADYVYNAHLSRHAGVDGQHVQFGDVIGFVGHTGNASGTPSHDHFEYHPGGGSAVSPYAYLNEVCGVGGAGF